MNKQIFLSGVIGLIIGIVIGVTHHNPATNMASGSQNMQMTMDSMTADLSTKQGADFDKAFITEMIVHHEGAVKMAEMALEKGQHAEIKTMANAIISAQTAEITQMRGWLNSWF